jgi:hypothetical protein
VIGFARNGFEKVLGRGEKGPEVTDGGRALIRRGVVALSDAGSTNTLLAARRAAASRAR